MKITFEGSFSDILKEIEALIVADVRGRKSATQKELPEFRPGVPMADLQGPGPEAAPLQKPPVDISVSNPVEKPVKPVDKPKRARTAKQLENDERLREAAKGKGIAKKAAAPVEKPKPQPKPSKTLDELLAETPPPKTAEGMDPAEVVRVRQQTIEELQAAYAGGHQKEVFELLSRFGNGAKSFRELPPEAFVPIREAIDNGALT